MRTKYTHTDTTALFFTLVSFVCTTYSMQDSWYQEVRLRRDSRLAPTLTPYTRRLNPLTGYPHRYPRIIKQHQIALEDMPRRSLRQKEIDKAQVFYKKHGVSRLDMLLTIAQQRPVR